MGLWVLFRLGLGLRPAEIGVVFGFQIIGLGRGRFCGKWARKGCLGLGCLGLFRGAGLGFVLVNWSWDRELGPIGQAWT